MDFERMFHEHQDRVFAFCYSMTGSRAEAEDVAQEVFLRAWRSLREWDDKRVAELSQRAWLHKIALNVVRNRVRASQSRPPLAASDAALAVVAAPGRAPESAVESRWLAERVAALPPPQREAVVLVQVQGFPYAEAAELTGRPLNTVKSDVHRGLASLRRMLEKEEVLVG
ncbi:MAG TPA: RNA polymerase sigma factor [Candidatus Dormibacteraeota bacterium]